MTDLVLDPPVPFLQLVASADPPEVSDRDARYRTLTLGAQARWLYRMVLSYSMEHGCAINPDALRVVLATRQTRQPGSLMTMTADHVWRLMMVDILGFCRARRLPVPDGCGHAIFVIACAMPVHDDRIADHIDEIEQALEECTGQWIEDLDGSSTPRYR